MQLSLLLIVSYTDLSTHNTQYINNKQLGALATMGNSSKSGNLVNLSKSIDNLIGNLIAVSIAIPICTSLVNPIHNSIDNIIGNTIGNSIGIFFSSPGQTQAVTSI